MVLPFSTASRGRKRQRMPKMPFLTPPTKGSQKRWEGHLAVLMARTRGACSLKSPAVSTSSSFSISWEVFFKER